MDSPVSFFASAVAWASDREMLEIVTDCPPMTSLLLLREEMVYTSSIGDIGSSNRYRSRVLSVGVGTLADVVELS